MNHRVTLIMVGLVGLSVPVAAATIQVTTTDPAAAADGQCSLIEAIDNANGDIAAHADCSAGSGADIIELATSATYELSAANSTLSGPNGLPVISSAITVNGHDSVIRRADGAPPFRLIAVDTTGVLNLEDLTLENGAADTYAGGALRNSAGQVTLSRVTVTGNSANTGGGIYNIEGAMTIADSAVGQNTAVDEGGGISSDAGYDTASLVLERTTVADNDVTNGNGGGISATIGGWGTQLLEVIGSTISGNTASASGGGIRTDHSRFIVEDSSIGGNHAGYSCAGVSFSHHYGNIDRTTFSGNIVDNTAGNGTGGGLCVFNASAWITNSTISGNQVLGPSSGQYWYGRGGGLSIVGGYVGTPEDTRVILEDSTICNNTADTTGGGISVFNQHGGIEVEVELRNTIVAENYEGGGAVLGNCVEESPAVITSSDFNLGDDPTCNFIGTDDLIVADVMLADLALNGGPTLTHLPVTGSPAIDSGDDAMCPATDQRDYVRPWDGDDDGQAHCDRGAVEFDSCHFFDGFESGDTSAWSATLP
jgi:hypothetical protein